MKAASAPGFPTRSRGGIGELAALRQTSASSDIRIARQGEAEILPVQPDHQVVFAELRQRRRQPVALTEFRSDGVVVLCVHAELVERGLPVGIFELSCRLVTTIRDED